MRGHVARSRPPRHGARGAVRKSAGASVEHPSGWCRPGSIPITAIPRRLAIPVSRVQNLAAGRPATGRRSRLARGPRPRVSRPVARASAKLRVLHRHRRAVVLVGVIEQIGEGRAHPPVAP